MDTHVQASVTISVCVWEIVGGRGGGGYEHGDLPVHVCDCMCVLMCVCVNVCVCVCVCVCDGKCDRTTV